MLDQIFLTVNEWMTGGIAIAAAGCFLWGMISVLFSPCHMASIPLIVSYVAGQNQVLEARQGAKYAIAFTAGLFITIALVGIVCSLLGRMLGEIGPYWTILVGAILIWVALDMLGVSACSMSGGLMGKFKLKGLLGAFTLGLAYGLLSGSCTFGFIAPILAFITIQKQAAIGIFYILLFGIGHCIPIAVAGSSTALVQRILENGNFQKGSIWFRKAAGIAIGLFGIYFIINPFMGA
ncbi:Cytochrome c biogenesis protein transmembrane domain-containing protein [Desulfonema limicola]|uniref:Cytochrome c biogenesis protein transmembrane domain-containing protein n=1 Tax=Desulfonema limicola TaxID=45656 RepID=A0A975B6D8_9BACT|nr:cytochrome c biogenesis protein CcdA [Desulfonema limicola]QTA79673.1 Cytochrome c biogenesis protein transmembrane domain-containing protein [Desulfonema limicola]